MVEVALWPNVLSLEICCSRERGTAESGALKANALPGGARRLAIRAVKAAWFSRSSERSVRALTGEADGSGAGFSQEGQTKKKLARPELYRSDLWR